MKIKKVATAEQFEKVIAAYRIQNPVKAAKKEKEWALKLAKYRSGEEVPVEEAPSVDEVSKVGKGNKNKK